MSTLGIWLGSKSPIKSLSEKIKLIMCSSFGYMFFFFLFGHTSVTLVPKVSMNSSPMEAVKEHFE